MSLCALAEFLLAASGRPELSSIFLNVMGPHLSFLYNSNIFLRSVDCFTDSSYYIHISANEIYKVFMNVRYVYMA